MKVEHLHSIDKNGIADDSATGSDKLATATAGSNKGVPLAGGARMMPPPDAPQDPFAPERFQIAQDYTAHVGGTKQITRVPVGRPDSQLWFHVNPDSAFTVDVALLDLRNERETYIVKPALAIEVPTEVVTKRLYQYVTRQGMSGSGPSSSRTQREESTRTTSRRCWPWRPRGSAGSGSSPTSASGATSRWSLTGTTASPTSARCRLATSSRSRSAGR
jgi:hypothetical protein